MPEALLRAPGPDTAEQVEWGAYKVRRASVAATDSINPPLRSDLVRSRWVERAHSAAVQTPLRRAQVEAAAAAAARMDRAVPEAWVAPETTFPEGQGLLVRMQLQTAELEAVVAAEAETAVSPEAAATWAATAEAA